MAIVWFSFGIAVTAITLIIRLLMYLQNRGKSQRDPDRILKEFINGNRD
jgi:hypothetical protein